MLNFSWVFFHSIKKPIEFLKCCCGNCIKELLKRVCVSDPCYEDDSRRMLRAAETLFLQGALQARVQSDPVEEMFQGENLFI